MPAGTAGSLARVYDRQVSEPRVFALSVHADYACRHSGACCTAGWHIPVEPRIRHLLKTEVLAPEPDGRCGCYDRAARRCSIHRDHGAALLPSSCDHFPRRALLDDRGAFVTLSHFCPTAAEQLFRTDRPLEIVESPPAFPSARQYEGLDGRGAWPPLLRPTAVFDHDSFSRWETFVVDAFAVEERSTDAALQVIAAKAEELRAWRADDGPLPAWTERVLAGEPDIAGRWPAPDRVRDWTGDGGPYHRFGAVQGFARVAAAVPAGLAAPVLPRNIQALLAERVDPAWDLWQTPARRYLAAKAFASWCAYQGRGVRTMVAELVAADMVLRVEAARACAAAGGRLDRRLMLDAIRAADHLLVHQADRQSLTDWFGEMEHACSDDLFARRSGRP